MTTSRLSALNDELDKLRSSMETINKTASDEGRDLSDSESADFDKLMARASELKPEVEKIEGRERQLAEIAEITKRTQSFSTPAPVAYTKPVTEPMTAGEYITEYVRASRSHDNAALDTLVRSQQGTSDTPGLIPTPILNTLVKFVDSNRYAVNAATRYPMPQGGKTFEIPRVTQPTRVDLQTDGAATPSEAEFGTLASQKMTVTFDTVTKHTYGGYVELSEQDIDWTDPSAWNIVTQDLAQQYAITTDTVLCNNIVTAATTKTTLSLTATSTVFTTAIATASAAVYTASKEFPNTLFAAPDRLAYLQGQSDTTGRPIFFGSLNAPGSVSDATSFGGDILGLRLVVDPNFPSGTLIVANTKFVQVFEQDKGLAQIPEVKTMSVVVSYRGYFTDKVYSQGLVYLAP